MSTINSRDSSENQQADFPRKRKNFRSFRIQCQK